jgi:hypothetical protein
LRLAPINKSRLIYRPAGWFRLFYDFQDADARRGEAELTDGRCLIVELMETGYAGQACSAMA